MTLGTIALPILFTSHYILNVTYSVKTFGIQVGLYNALWVCSLSLLLASFGIMKSKPSLVFSSMIAVGPGHVLWIFDTLYLLITQTSYGGPFDVADYNSISGRPTFLSVYTTTHHLWFLPLCFGYLLACKPPQKKICFRHLLHANYWVMFVSFVSVLVVPVECVDVALKDGSGDKACIDVNVNMVKQWWGLEDNG